MKKSDRLKELEKIAEQLGIGQNREVECVSCHKKIQFKDAILITNKEKVSHICKECNEKLIKGKLTDKQINEDDILKQIETMRKEAEKNKIPAPYKPDIDPWNPYYPATIKDVKWKVNDIEYNIYSSQSVPEGSMLLKFEPK